MKFVNGVRRGSSAVARRTFNESVLVLKWALRHGAARMYLKPMARQGDPHARLWFDVLSETDLAALQDELRSADGVIRGKGGTVVTSHHLARDILARPGEYRNLEPSLALRGWLGKMHAWVSRAGFSDPFEYPSVVGLEGKPLGAARGLLRPKLSRSAVEALRPELERRAENLCAELSTSAQNVQVDIVTSYAQRLSQEVLSMLFDIEVDVLTEICADAEDLSRLVDLGLPLGEFRRLGRAGARLDRWTDAQIERIEPGATSIIASSVAAMRAGEISYDQLRRTINLVVVASYSTTISALAAGIKMLIENPAQLDLLAENPDLWRNAADEVLRLAGPVMMMPRWTLSRTQVGNVQLKPARPVYVTGADTDPKQYECPYAFRVSRRNAGTHLAFGGGAHRCLGATLAQAEIEIGMRVFFSRFAGASLVHVRRGPSMLVRTWDELVVKLPRVTTAPSIRPAGPSADRLLTGSGNG